ncbi:MAG: hypothetical protein LBF58_01420 [Deltaproteobacteria bacterium]|nr:hypothetical protein [Deltaproteobacteria bacterium]
MAYDQYCSLRAKSRKIKLFMACRPSLPPAARTSVCPKDTTEDPEL